MTTDQPEQFFDPDTDEADIKEWAKKYDPSEGPDPEEWLSLDEQEQQLFIAAYHEVNEPHPVPPAPRMHYIMHSVVENKIAAGENDLPNIVARLVGEGLTRHQAIHAVSTAFARLMWNLANAPDDEKAADPEKQFMDELNGLTAKKWLAKSEKN